MYIRRVKFSLQSTSFTTLLGENVGHLLFDRRAHTELKTAMSHPHVFFCILQCDIKGCPLITCRLKNDETRQKYIEIKNRSLIYQRDIFFVIFQPFFRLVLFY